jgi:hypothetical protein
MTKTNKLFSLITLVLALGLGALGQTSLTMTSLAAAQGAGPAALASGINTPYLTFVNLTSATGVQQAQNGAPVTYIYVDQEAEAILTLLTGQTTIFNVLRGQLGTKESAHASGAMVLLQVVSPQFGGGSGSGGLQTTDPPVNGACLASGTVYTPWVNVLTSSQWLCSTLTGTWVPGFNNQYGGTAGQLQPTAAVASATTILPSGPLFHLTGTTAYATITLPVGFSRGCIDIIQDGAAETWTAAGNIISASTSTQTVGEMVTFCYDPITTKFYPSHN